MEGGFPMLNCLLQHTLRSLCACSESSTSAKWVYAVFWRILPRNYPPPKWDHGGGLLDRAKGNKRNWILVWEDGFCDFFECERTASGYAKGRLVGKVASDNSHKWVFRDTPTENDPTFIPWNVSIDPQPRAWEAQFSSGIETIAIISVREGAIQLGSFDKVFEDLNMVINIQRKFSYLQSIPGIYVIQRPYLPIQTTTPNTFNHINRKVQSNSSVEDKHHHHQVTGLKRQSSPDDGDDSPSKSIYLGDNSPQNLWSIPPLLPSMSCNIGAFLPKIPQLYYSPDGENTLINSNHSSILNCVSAFDDIQAVDVKVEEVPVGMPDDGDGGKGKRPGLLKHGIGGLGFEKAFCKS
ncbi:uncharacterized protein LOC127265180 isoform X2 [Andrographis paniculata]|uniref:uncharacterized protein LOC127265180 isoform X2 n=1 Tax=Andrographis paniculata TaxID=175694 RepID=UPI0021E91A80|nr:uncharacterized protein LOC127265180 isoform X2 [Andrographis paniculata]